MNGMVDGGVNGKCSGRAKGLMKMVGWWECYPLVWPYSRGDVDDATQS